MAYFDFLNTPANAPDPTTRYWYDFDMMWDRSLPFLKSSRPTSQGRVVHKLNLEHPKSGFTFEFVDEPGKEYHCNYTWAFVRCSPGNWWRRKLRDRIGALVDVLGNLMARLAEPLDSLKK
jgi:hypothetical protein